MVRRREGLTLPILRPVLPDVRTSTTTTPVGSQKPKKRLSKQLSMSETPRDIAWERRKLQMIMIQEKKLLRKGVSDDLGEHKKLTDEDLDELKGSIELGFGFNEEEAGQKLCNTLPALDLYFAVNRNLSPLPSPCTSSRSSNASASAFLIPCSPKMTDSDSLKILGPGDNPQEVKQRLRHWAQAVACSMMQSY
ncbi:unnamed protein product [Cochlearia groenlandica]